MGPSPVSIVPYHVTNSLHHPLYPVKLLESEQALNLKSRLLEDQPKDFTETVILYTELALQLIHPNKKNNYQGWNYLKLQQ